MMEPIPIHDLPPPLPSIGRPQRDKNKNQQDAQGRLPAKDEAKGDAADGSDTSGSERETPRRGSDGIVGNLIDFEA
jgi:hypothetical protein